MKTFTQYIFEGKASLSRSNFSDNPIRFEKFKELISQGFEFELVDKHGSKKVVIDKAVLSVLSDDPSSIPASIDTTDGPHTIGHFFKIPELGGGKGSGGGAASTRLMESLQCLYCSLAFNVVKGNISTLHLLSDNLKSAAKYIDVDEQFDNLLNVNQQDWIDGTILAANKIYNYLGNHKYTMHRGSKFMKKIYQNKTDLMKKELGTDLNPDKWNPGDVWFVTSEGEKQINRGSGSIDDYNLLIKRLFQSRDLVGISLKKIGGSVAIDAYNIEVEVVDDKFSSFITSSKRNDFFNSIDVYLFSDKNTTIQLRAFGKITGWQAEIKEKLASGGKMSLGPINMLLRRLKHRILPDSKRVSKAAKEPNNVFWKEFHRLYEKYSDEQSMSLEDFILKATSGKMSNPQKAHSFRYSKFLGLKFIDILNGTSKRSDKDDIIKGMIRYARSSTDLSSVYIKVH